MIRRRAEEMRPWRYDHQAAELTIAGDPVAAPIHGSLGRGRDIMRLIISRLASRLDVPNARVLDLGCLEGHYTDLLCEAGFGEVVGIELSERNVARARFLLEEVRQCPNVRLIHGDVEDDQLLSSLGHFDIILFHGLLYHMKDPVAAVGRVRRLGSPAHSLLLGTQFKFNFADIIARTALASIKLRSRQAAMSSGSDSGQQSVYADYAVRLNPCAILRTLKHFGYGELIAYDTPLGARYGYQLQLIARQDPDQQFLNEMRAIAEIPGLQFYKWHGDRIDGVDLRRGMRAFVPSALSKLSYSVSELLGRSGEKQLRRAEISSLAKDS